MSGIFTIEIRHIFAFIWVFAWSIVFTIGNKNDYYTYSDRIISWFAGVLIGLVTGVLIL